MKSLFALLLPFQLFATNYNPQSVAQANALQTKFGDSVFFTKGKIYTGELKPKSYTYYSGSVLQGDIYCYQVTNVTMNGFQITGSDYGITLDQSTGCTILNCEILKCGIGIAIQANNNIISNCYIHDLRMVRNDSLPNNDYGANGIVVSSSGNLITNCLFVNCWAKSIDYGYDGGAIEMYGTVNNNIIVNNVAAYNCGFMEFGSSGAGTANNDSISNNLLINNGRTFWVNNSGKFTINVSGLKFYNNTVIDTAKQAYWDVYEVGMSVPTICMDFRNNYFNTILPILKSGNIFTHTNCYPLDKLLTDGNYKLQIGIK
jgi:parallel beta-helix repeat protein